MYYCWGIRTAFLFADMVSNYSEGIFHFALDIGSIFYALVEEKRRCLKYVWASVFHLRGEGDN